jgi:hypothetical protein
MMPKVIHYCWFGGSKLPKLAKKCIDSWKIYFPNFQIKEWNEANFDVNIIPYTRDAYVNRKFAFVSDYARFWILYNYGGLYFDVDVEVVKSFDDILSMGAFMGCELQSPEITVAPGLGLGCPPGLEVYKEILDIYSKLIFINNDGSLNLTTVVQYMTAFLKENGLENKGEIQNIRGINIYPKEYFCPDLAFLKLASLPAETHSIHHYAASWLTGKNKIKNIVYKFITKHPILAYWYVKYYRKRIS